MIKEGDKYRVTGYNCGKLAFHRLNAMGIIPDRIMEVISIQPYDGPYTIRVGEEVLTIGRGLFSKILYEEVK